MTKHDTVVLIYAQKILRSFTYTTPSTLYFFFNRFDNFGFFSWIEICCFWRGNNNAFINTNGLEIIFYRHSDGLHLWRQARSTLHAQIKMSDEWTKFFEWKKSNFVSVQNVLFKLIFDSNDSVPLPFFWLKHNGEIYFLSQITICK